MIHLCLSADETSCPCLLTILAAISASAVSDVRSLTLPFYSSMDAINRFFQRLTYNRRVLTWIHTTALSLIGGFLSPGGHLFTLLEKWYHSSLTRLIADELAQAGVINGPGGAKIDQSKETAADWDNPNVVGRKRRPAHAPLRAFPDTASAREFWADLVADPTKIPHNVTSNVMMLTGEPGEPSMQGNWEFLLVGDPKLAPTNWISFGESAKDNKTTMNGNSTNGNGHIEATSPEPWLPIALPSHWQLASSGLPAATRDIPIYTNTSYPFPMTPPIARRSGKWLCTDCDRGVLKYEPWMDMNGAELDPREKGPFPAGLYRRRFELPDSWVDNNSGDAVASDSRIFLVFEGVDASVRAWVDGQFAGFSQDSALPAEFDVTDLLGSSSKEHTLAVEVLRWCDASYVEDQDKWWISGIYREAYLVRKPKAMISDYKVAGKASDGTMEVEILTEDAAAERCAVRVEVYEGADGGKGSEPVAVGTAVVGPGQQTLHSAAALTIADPAQWEAEFDAPKTPGIAKLSLKVSNHKLWSSETPNLYTVVFSLHATLTDANSNTKPMDIESCRTGFVEISFSNDASRLLTVNGRPITVAGVNRPEFHAELGRAIPMSIMASDLQLMKRLNFNALRTAHYPSHSMLLELCNQAGIHVVGEANLESHGFQVLGQPAGYLASHPDWKGHFITRCSRMWARDANHPCLLAWSVGNECGVGRNVVDAANWLRAADLWKRPVQYESGGLFNAATDILAPMYARLDTCLRGAQKDSKRRPLILCEYAHAMGNSGGCMNGYWKLFRDRKNTRMQGGFIWDWRDQALILDPGLPNLPANLPTDRKCYGYGGDFGDLPHSGQFCCNGVLAADGRVHPTGWEAWACQSPVAASCNGKALVVNNRYEFLSLGHLDIRVRVGCDSGVDGGGAWVSLSALDKLAPGASKEFDLESLFSGWRAALSEGSTALAKLLGLSSAQGLSEISDCWLEFVARTKDDNYWMHKGTAVCHVTLPSDDLQAALSKSKAGLVVPNAASPTPGSMTTSPDGNLTVRFGAGFTAVIGSACGRLLSFTTPDGSQLLSQPLDVCINRASTDNDRGGGPLSYDGCWIALGLFDLVRKPTGKDGTSIFLAKVEESSGSVVVDTAFDLVSAESALLAGTKIPCRMRYQFLSTGDVKVTSIVSPSSSIAPLPRAGISFAVPRILNNVTWSGLGPHESYDDRVQCVRQGLWTSSVDQLYEPYMYPGECGRRGGMSWMALESGEGHGLAVVCAAKDAQDRDRYGFSALPYSTKQLWDAKHDWELVPDTENVFVVVDSRSMGVGGYDSWLPSVDKEYLLPSGLSLVTDIVIAAGGVQGARAVART